MQTFTFALPTRVIFGAGAIDTVGTEARSLGTHALLVTGTAFAQRSGLLDRISASLREAGVATSVYDRLGPNPRTDAIDAGGQAARSEGADFVLGLGGGSALDAAKMIAAAALAERPIWDFTRHHSQAEPPPIQRALPIMQVPMVASTGSESNDTAVVFNAEAQIKAFVRSPCLQARVAIVDPTLTFTLPSHFTAVGGMNIVSQLLESYLTSDEFPVSDRITEGLVRVVMDSLPRAMRRAEDLEARSNLSWAAALGPTLGLAGRGGATPLRTMAHPVSAHFSLDHGFVVAALWPSYMRYALSNRYRLPQIGRFKRYALLGRQLFGVHETDDEVAAETTAYRFVNWLKGMDMPTSLQQLGIQDADFSSLSDEAVLVSGTGNRLPGGLTVEDVEHIYEGALRQA